MKIGDLTSLTMSSRLLSETQKSISQSLQRLGSGSRLASPRLDLSSLSSSQNLQARMRSALSNIRSANQAYSRLSLSAGVLDSQTQLLQRMREIAVQASSSTLSSQARRGLNTEVQQILEELQRLSSMEKPESFTIQTEHSAKGSITLENPRLGINDLFPDTLETSTQVSALGQFTAQGDQVSTLSSGPTAIRAVDVNGNGLDRTTEKLLFF